MSIVDRVIQVGGGAGQIAVACRVHRTSVLFWRRLGHIPAKHVVAVEGATGIPREELRPDLFVRATPVPQRENAA